MQLTRRQVFGTLAAGVAYPFAEAQWLDVSRRTVVLPGLRTPIRVLHLSDLHFSWTVPLFAIEHAITAGLAEKPDLICITGDFITSGADFASQSYATVLKRLSAFAPTYAVLGNHDGGSWSLAYEGRGDHLDIDRLLGDSSIEVLHNRSVAASVRDSSITLVGTGDLWSEELDGDRAFKLDGDRAFKEVTRERGPVVVLNHNPDGKDLMARQPWQLMLSGHAHGGQVRLPFWGGSFAPVTDKRYVEDLKPWGERQIHVSRGVGNVKGVRFRCRPEVTLLELRNSELRSSEIQGVRSVSSFQDSLTT